MVDKVCGDLPEVTIPTSVPPKKILESQVTVLKASHIGIETVWIEFEQHIAKLQMKLQLEKPLDLLVQCSTEEKETTNSGSTSVVECGSLLYESMFTKNILFIKRYGIHYIQYFFTHNS